MHRKNVFNLLLLVTVLFITSCMDSDDEKPDNYFEVNGEKFMMSEAYIDDDGTDNEITYRSYDILLCDSKETKGNYVQFTTLSNSTLRLEEGTYSYKYFLEKGYFGNPEIGMNIEYDSKGQAINGTRYTEYNMNNIMGSVIITQEEGDYKFVINLSFEVDGVAKTAKVIYWGPLSEDYFL